MRVALESKLLVPNASFVVAAFLVLIVLIVLGLLAGGPAWLLTSRRGATPDR